MGSITEKPWFRKFLISLVGKPRLKEFDAISHRLKATQDSLLKKIVKTSKDTVFGKEHGFHTIQTIDDFRKAVPISGFGRHRPYVERMCKGEADVLFPGRPLFYNTTSGTTSRPKLIPVSRDYFENAYSGLNKLWLYTCLKDNPHIYDGKSLSAVSPAEEGTVEDGTPYGAISGMAFKNIPNVLKSTYSCPYSVICIKDYIKKYYTMMRFALEADITIIIAASPASVLRLYEIGIECSSDLIKDIRDGTLRKDVVDTITPPDREDILSRLKPNKARAQELERFINTYGEDLRPKHYWPNIALVNTWKQGNFARIIPKLDGLFPEATVIRAFGYQASEGRAGLVLGNDWDYSVCAAHIYHFEFIEEEARQQIDPPVLQAHEVEVGKRYYIIFSNGSGLYRYDINDIVQITGFYNQIPCFRFIQKGEGITSLTGEKLSEEQVMQAIAEVTEEKSIGVEFYTMFCDENDLCYKLFVEFKPGVENAQKEKFPILVDEKLRKLNPEYEVKRGTKRLDAPLFYEFVNNAYEQLKETLVAAGISRAGQYKEVYLTRKVEMLQYLEGLVKKE